MNELSEPDSNYLHRPMIDSLPTDNELVGVEIGVRRGHNAEQILKNHNIKMLYLVDPYCGYFDTANSIAKDFGYTFQYAEAKLAKYKDKIRFIKKLSEDAVKDIPDGLDFVYIDGNHNYEFVKKDVELYFPKLKIGGTIGGHDFSDTEDIRKVATDFARINGLHLNVEHKDWWTKKR